MMKLTKLNNKHPFWFKFVYNNSFEYDYNEYYTIQIYFLRKYIFDMVYWTKRKF